MDNQEGELKPQPDSILEEAEQLIWAVLDDQVEKADLERLETLLHQDEQIRKRYIQCVQLHTDLATMLPAEAESPPEDLPETPIVGSLGDIQPDSDTMPQPGTT